MNIEHVVEFLEERPEQERVTELLAFTRTTFRTRLEPYERELKIVGIASMLIGVIAPIALGASVVVSIGFGLLATVAAVIGYALYIANAPTGERERAELSELTDDAGTDALDTLATLLKSLDQESKSKVIAALGNHLTRFRVEYVIEELGDKSV